MHFSLWQQRILMAVGLLLVVVPVIGLPIIIKNIFFVLAGLTVMTLLIRAESPAKSSLSPTEALTPSAYQPVLKKADPEPSFLKKDVHYLPTEKTIDALVPSPIKTTTVRRRRIKVANTDLASDHGKGF